MNNAEQWWTKKISPEEMKASWIRENMKRFEIDIEVTYTKTITIEAVDEKEAQSKVENDIEWEHSDTNSCDVVIEDIEEVK
jgi:hypothetical protein